MAVIQNNKYNNSMVYTIRSPHTDNFYIGSTTQKLCKRFANHKSCHNSYVNNTGNYITSFKIIELGDSYIELLEDINCDTKTQLEMREGELIRIHKDLCINKRIEGRTSEQYRQDNVDKRKQYDIDNVNMIKQQRYQYRQDNADKIKQQQKQYDVDNADKIKQRRKQYKHDNADQIKQQQKQYNIDNADKIKQRRKQYKLDNADKIKQSRKQCYQNTKIPKISISKEDYDVLVCCDKLMNLQYSYKNFIIVE